MVEELLQEEAVMKEKEAPNGDKKIKTEPDGDKQHKGAPDGVKKSAEGEVIFSFVLCPVDLTHCGLVTPYGDRDMGQRWLR